MGNHPSSYKSTEAASQQTNNNTNESTKVSQTIVGCPVQSSLKPPVNSSSSECPMKSDKSTYKNPNVYNVLLTVFIYRIHEYTKYLNTSSKMQVYSEKINPTNQMPQQANQLPSKEQTMPLNTERVKSSIPKGGTESETWLYPSAQMVYFLMEVIFIY